MGKTKRTIYTTLLTFLVLCLNACGQGKPSHTTEQRTIETPPKTTFSCEHTLWQKTVEPYLKDPLWKPRDSYDAGHLLMVPLHYAFLAREKKWQTQFIDHFKRFVPQEMGSERLQRLQYLYLASRFLVLAQPNMAESTLKKRLFNFLFEEIAALWTLRPAWQWDHSDFPAGIKERLLFKLTLTSPKYSYYTAIIDEEHLLFAIAADLITFAKASNTSVPPALTEIVSIAFEVYKDNVIWGDNNAWLFQPGAWQDHPDYLYAGHVQKIPKLPPAPISNIASDSSHTLRFPLWIRSLASAFPLGSQENVFFIKLHAGLEKQLWTKVLKAPDESFPGFRMTNYMDGRNGLFRYKYETVVTNLGYGPFELSGSLLLGWWTFLGTERMLAVYKQIAQQFPLPQNMVDLYVGPNTTRDRHPLVKAPDSYYNGFHQLIVLLASKSTFRLANPSDCQ